MENSQLLNKESIMFLFIFTLLCLYIITLIISIFRENKKHKQDIKNQPILNNIEINEIKKIEISEKIDSNLNTKLKLLNKNFIFNNIVPILVEFKAISAENSEKLIKKYIEFIEFNLSGSEKKLYSSKYNFVQFQAKLKLEIKQIIFDINIYFSVNNNDIILIYVDEKEAKKYNLIKEICTGKSDDHQIIKNNMKSNDLQELLKNFK